MRREYSTSYIRFLTILFFISVLTSTSALRTTDAHIPQRRIDPTADISIRMTVTYGVPIHIEPAALNTFQTPVISAHQYDEVPIHVSLAEPTSRSTSRRADPSLVTNICSSQPSQSSGLSHSTEPKRSIVSTCIPPEECRQAGDCAPGGIYAACESGKMCCQAKTTIASTERVPENSKKSNQKSPMQAKPNVNRESLQGEELDGLPPAFRGYLLLSDHPKMPPSAPTAGRNSQGGPAQAVSVFKSHGRTRPEPARSTVFDSGRLGGPPIRAGTPGTTPLSKLKQKETELLPNTFTCGPVYIDSRIIKGKDAEIGQFPWMALLGFKAPPKSGVNFICAGSLISDRYVLTAAHCFSSQNALAEVRLGEYDLSRNPDSIKTNIVDPYRTEIAEEIVIHPNFSRSLLSHDIALVRLKNRITSYSMTIKPVCLPFDVEFRGGTRKYTIAGWGKTDYSHSNGSNIIQTTDVHLLSHSDCVERGAPYNLPITTDQICAGGNQGHDVCSGDSGGPLTRVSQASSPTAQPATYIVGIVSFGADMPCGTAGLPSVYTKVSSYLSWILENMRA